MQENRFWWPLLLNSLEEEAFNRFRQQMLHTPATIDETLAQFVIDNLARLMKLHIADIIERDGLPHLCHVINGWGNAKFKGNYLIESIAPFAHRNCIGKYTILQCDPEGDFHPWQTFAYAVMAGINPDYPISSIGFTLRTLAENSKEINTTEGRELGHLLFALAYLDSSVATKSFTFGGKACDVPALMELAIDAHHYGTFDVCRKFHLTEGLCAAASLIKGLENYREAAQGFLDGQMDMLILLEIVLHEVKLHIKHQRPVKEGGLLLSIRKTLRIGNLIENHFYYAGHLIELAILAANLGYSIAPEHWNSMAFIINELNITLSTYLPYLSFLDCFLTLGHYRRAVSLFLEYKCAQAEKRNVTREDMARFTVDFDKLYVDDKFMPTTTRPNSLSEGGVYDIAYILKKPRAEFIEVVNKYASLAKANLQPRGKFDHFRRIGPPSWPRAFHYELLDYGKKIGIEIHMESEAVLSMRDTVRSLEQRVSAKFPKQQVEWDPTWWHEHGRLRIIFDEGTPANDIAKSMHLLILNTFDDLDKLASRLEVNPLNSGLLAA